MKALASLAIVVVIVSCLINALPVFASSEPLVGVKEGDWIEYEINVTGVGIPPPTHDVRWMRIEVLPVQDTAFSINLTARYANGTIGSAIWNFNFTEGNVGGWIIIPADLGPGDTFYDLSIHTGNPVNVTIQSQEEKTVFGALRTVTYGSDHFRHKEWDKATGVFIGSSEVYRNVTTKDGHWIEDLTVTVEAVATNLWSQDTILGLKPAVVYALIVVVAVLATLPLIATFLYRRKKAAVFTLSVPMQKKLAILTIIVVVTFEVAAITVFPFHLLGISFAEINLVIQTIWTGLVLVSMWFRLKGHYFIHEVTILIVTLAWIVGFTAILFMNPFATSTEAFSSTTLRWVMNALHGIFSIPALVFSAWLAALWRPGSTSFPTKSRRIALLLVVFWIASYVVGFLDFLVLHTGVFE